MGGQLEGWVAKRGMGGQLEGWVAKRGMGGQLEGWVAKSVARQLATAVLWIPIYNYLYQKFI
jgi:hypothetical protein